MAHLNWYESFYFSYLDQENRGNIPTDVKPTKASNKILGSKDNSTEKVDDTSTSPIQTILSTPCGNASSAIELV